MHFRPRYAFAPLAISLAVPLMIAPRQVDFVTLDRHAQPLQTRFNADSGKVRIVMLVAPT